MLTHTRFRLCCYFKLELRLVLGSLTFIFGVALGSKLGCKISKMFLILIASSSRNVSFNGAKNSINILNVLVFYLLIFPFDNIPLHFQFICFVLFFLSFWSKLKRNLTSAKCIITVYLLKFNNFLINILINKVNDFKNENKHFFTLIFCTLYSYAILYVDARILKLSYQIIAQLQTPLSDQHFAVF